MSLNLKPTLSHNDHNGDIFETSARTHSVQIALMLMSSMTRDEIVDYDFFTVKTDPLTHLNVSGERAV